VVEVDMFVWRGGGGGGGGVSGRGGVESGGWGRGAVLGSTTRQTNFHTVI